MFILFEINVINFPYSMQMLKFRENRLVLAKGLDGTVWDYGAVVPHNYTKRSGIMLYLFVGKNEEHSLP